MKIFFIVGMFSWLLVLFCLAGCGPFKSTAMIRKAELAVHSAKTARADQKSPYEFFSAEQYLHKAREKWSTSDFQYAIDYAGKARDLAILARDRSLQPEK